MMTTSPLATFDDRFTMRHVRVYPHAIDDVFAAITTTDDLNAWMLPICEVEPRAGGRCAFTWGGPRGTEMLGTVTVFDPPSTVHYQLDDSFLRFELTARDDETTELVLLHRIVRARAETLELWPPDVAQGFHVFADRLGELLDGVRDLDQARGMLDAAERGIISSFLASLPVDDRERSEQLIARYREHILEHCPTE